jgi:sugar lactone lactonase YvrE
MSKFTAALAVAVLALGGYLAFAPIPAQPVAWTPPRDAGYSGAHARNNRLSPVNRIPLARDQGPEHIVARDGWIYTGLNSGAVVRLRADAPADAQPEVLLNTGGRPLGLDFDADGHLLIADGMKGLLKATLPANGRPAGIETLVSKVDDAVNGTPVLGDPIRYADAVLVAKNGTVFFTDASRRFAPAQWGGTFDASVLDTLEHSCTGRLLAYDPQTRYTRVVLRDLCFPNGLALTASERHLLLSETGAYRILRVAVNLDGLSAPQAIGLPGDVAKVLIDNLPGFPDNLMRGEGGRIWVGLTKPRSGIIDFAARHPWMRALTLRLPKVLWPVPPAYGHVFAFDDAGKVLVDLQDPAGGYPETTAVTEAGGRLYIQSLNARSIGWISKQAAGL